MNQTVVVALISALSGASMSSLVKWIGERVRKTRRPNLMAQVEGRISEFQRSKIDDSRPLLFRRFQASALRDQVLDAIYAKPFQIGSSIVMFLSFMIFFVSSAYLPENPNDPYIIWWELAWVISLIVGAATLLRMAFLTIGRETLRFQLEQVRKSQTETQRRRHIGLKVAWAFAFMFSVPAPTIKDILELRKQLEVH
ncbi:hypothetical protein F8O06_05295 [Pseudoclavibacter sp. CFCC 14310]|uniref:hypothetical protein n=1 Tax=Pseudoclavibacter sp. CFCC 14310 TaxID=2615180 RepID=UPI00130191D6|nr:hypothetical protein [Pseudoclavibacter sp. CFCC 14310]KAB1646181.1 hypothetical protein F8O06_05295 [Pseudoclavibacter sp. CFCC 14310]